ncbi:acyl dehydratase [Nocardia transvalensis]|uniref:Acyl dehydratase n=1 Tax=Nocardia transvalensis TaxID=37333 RepID=A0A7W9UK48_9NOCA|nr:fused (3R)-hydroxyacyl-ACP dehydratase subunits HadA/HadB [Nocardia transvalensis]MBB5915962.1 acyl dehydratase [Nocardia transvalensis]
MERSPAAHARAMVGHHYTTDDFYEVGREKIREYATVVRDDHPAHRRDAHALASGYRGLLAPSTFVSPVGMRAQQTLLEQVAVGYDLSRLLQTDQVLRFHQPIVAGDRLACDVSLESFEQVRGRDMMVIKNAVSNQRNELVHTAYTTVLVGATGQTDPAVAAAARNLLAHNLMNIVPDGSEAASPAVALSTSGLDPVVVTDRPAPRGRRIDEVSAGEELPHRTVRLTRGDLVHYAGLAGDGNPIHWSDEFARLVGLETVVAHGVLVMGIGAGHITSWLGDPGAVEEYSVRFTYPVYVDIEHGATIEFAGHVKSVDPATGTAVIAMDTRCNGKRVFGHKATATVRLARA